MTWAAAYRVFWVGQLWPRLGLGFLAQALAQSFGFWVQSSGLGGGFRDENSIRGLPLRVWGLDAFRMQDFAAQGLRLRVHPYICASCMSYIHIEVCIHVYFICGHNSVYHIYISYIHVLMLQHT